MSFLNVRKIFYVIRRRPRGRVGGGEEIPLLIIGHGRLRAVGPDDPFPPLTKSNKERDLWWEVPSREGSDRKRIVQAHPEEDFKQERSKADLTPQQ